MKGSGHGSQKVLRIHTSDREEILKSRRKGFLSSSHVQECVNEGHEFLLRAQLLLEEVRAVCGAS